MFSEQIELRGHIIDSLTLPKVLDEILTHGGTFSIRQIKIGQQRTDASHACIDVFGPTPETVDDIVRRLQVPDPPAPAAAGLAKGVGRAGEANLALARALG